MYSQEPGGQTRQQARHARAVALDQALQRHSRPTWFQPGLQARRVLNEATFAMRQALRFRRNGYREGPLDLARCAPSLHAELTSPRAVYLADHYGLAALAPQLGTAAFTKSLYTLDLLDHLRPHLARGTQEVLRLLDVGTKNAEAAPGLCLAATKMNPHATIALHAVEIDAYPVYQSLHSRADAAHYYLGLLPGTHTFHAADVRDFRHSCQLITCLAPFLGHSPLLYWGLPLRYLRPHQQLHHLHGLLAPGGVLVIVNHNADEAEQQRDMLTALEITFEAVALPPLVGRPGRPCTAYVVSAAV